MERDFTIPQGAFKAGRDIPEGVYLIAALNNFSIIQIIPPTEGSREHYTLEKDNTMMVHVELEKGDILKIDGRVIMRHITRFIEDDKCNLLEEIESFENDLKARGVKKR